jgi:hypothetical protein
MVADIDRHKRVGLAAKIIGVDKSREAEFQRDIKLAITFIERLKRNKLFGVIRNTKEKQAVRQFGIALRRLEIAFDNPELDQYLHAAFPLDKFEFERWLTYCKEAANVPLPKSSTKGKLRPATAAKRYAAKAAARLLKRHGLPVHVTRKGAYCRLAAVLYGDKDADMFEQCRSVLDLNEGLK